MADRMGNLFPARAIFNTLGALMKQPMLLEDGKIRLDRNDFIAEDVSKFHLVMFATISNLYDKGSVNITPTDVEGYLADYPDLHKTFMENDGVNWCYEALELSEVKKQNNLLRERMLQIENLQNKRNQKIDTLLEKLDKGTKDWNYNVQQATEQVSRDLLNTQRNNFDELKQSFENQNKLSKQFHKIQGYSFFALSIIAMILFIGLIARTLALGVWEGLFLENLWNLGEWYWSLLAVVILIGLIAGVVFLIIRGIQSLR